jgi:hypothetical protein
VKMHPGREEQGETSPSDERGEKAAILPHLQS